MADLIPIIIALLAFGAVAALVLVAGRYMTIEMQVQRRLPAHMAGGQVVPVGYAAGLHSFVARHFDETSYGINTTLRGKLRRELLKAGYFRADALNYYIFARLAAVIVIPLIAYAILQTFFESVPFLLKFLILVISLLIAILGPDAYISRRQRILADQYRIVFPECLDLITVCVDAGLSLEAALERVTNEIAKHSREFGLNLSMVGAETRAGRSTVEALESLADRLGLDEARTLVLVLRQSIELGSSISDALHVFSDEMRGKRLLRAEEAANKLPVKMVLPLGLFIFPIILLVVMLPLALRVMAVLKF